MKSAKFIVAIVFILLISICMPPFATITTADSPSGTGLIGEYFNNPDLTDYALTRQDPNINFTWGAGSPDPSIDPAYFSVRWTGKIQPLFSEMYTLSMEQSDGARIWVNGVLILDEWEDEVGTKVSAPIALTAGNLYDIQVEFCVYGTGATAILQWSSLSQQKQVVPQEQLFTDTSEPPVYIGTGTGLTGEYYNSSDLTDFALTRQDPNIDFAWGAGSPDPSMGPDYFSVRWTGKIQPMFSESYTFTMKQSDGARIWVNGVLILDEWEYGIGSRVSAPIELIAGELYDIKVEFCVYGTGATAILKWTSPSQAMDVVPQQQLYVNEPNEPNTPSTFTASTDFSSVQGHNQWYYQYWNGSSYVDMTWRGTTYWQGEREFCRLTNIKHHPDYDCDSARKWVAPVDGTITITGKVAKFDTIGGDGVNVKVMKNNTQIWPGTGWRYIAYNDDVGEDLDLTTSVQAGDAIYFIVNQITIATNDSTLWDPTISYVEAQVDEEAPSAPTNLTVESRTVDSAIISWTASTDNVGVSEYEIYNDTLLLGTVDGNTTTYTITGMTANTTYHLTVNARDEAGNTSISSNPVMIFIDTEAPTAPTNLEAIILSNNSVKLSWSASTDNKAVTGYEILNGSTLIGAVDDSTTTYTVTGMAANTPYNFAVRAKDVDGNISANSNIVNINLILKRKLKYNYDQSGRLQTIEDAETNEVLLIYLYDDNGNLLQIVRAQNGQ